MDDKIKDALGGIEAGERLKRMTKARIRSATFDYGRNLARFRARRRRLAALAASAVLCIGGGVSRAGDALLLPLKEKVRARLYSKNSKRNTNIALAKLDNDAGIIGAALLGC